MSSTTVTLVASGTQTASGNSGPLTGFGSARNLRCQLATTAASGTAPTLNVIIQDSIDGTNWNTVGTFTQVTAAGAQMVNISAPVCDNLRVSWTIAGTTPSFTFSVLAEVVY